jgi:hypothetical protein
MPPLDSIAGFLVQIGLETSPGVADRMSADKRLRFWYRDDCYVVAIDRRTSDEEQDVDSVAVSLLQSELVTLWKDHAHVYNG